MQSDITRFHRLQGKVLVLLGALVLLAVPDLFGQVLPTLGQLAARERASLDELNTNEDLDNPIYVSIDEEQDENIGTIKILREGRAYRPLRFHLSTDLFSAS